jgi:hypothetical protein
MNNQLKSLIEEYFPHEKKTAEHLIQSVMYGVLQEMEQYSESQYRKYKLSVSPSVRDSDWVLGTCDGADKCVDIIKKCLTFVDG